MDDKIIRCSMCGLYFVPGGSETTQARDWNALRLIGSISFGNTRLELRDCREPCLNTLGRMTTRKGDE